MCRNSIMALRGHGKALICVQFTVTAPVFFDRGKVMELRNLEIDKIKYARVGYYNPDWQTCELKHDEDMNVNHMFDYPEQEALVLLYETPQGYINLFNPDEMCNVFEWQTIVTKQEPYELDKHIYAAITYRCSYECLSGEADGKCYILDKQRKFGRASGYTEPTISYEMLIKEMSKHRAIFYVDRWNATLENKNSSITDKIKVVSTDFARRKKYQRFCEEKEAERK